MDNRGRAGNLLLAAQCAYTDQRQQKEGDRRAPSCVSAEKNPNPPSTGPRAGFRARQSERKSVSVYMCPACAVVLTLTTGSIVPRPCPQCLESTGRVVEMVQQEPTPQVPPAVGQTQTAQGTNGDPGSASPSPVLPPREETAK